MFWSGVASSRVVDFDVPAPNEAADGVDIDFAEPDAVPEAKCTGLSPKTKLHLRVRCFRSTHTSGRAGRLA